MIASFSLLAIGFALGVAVAVLAELLMDRRHARRARAHAELARHQAPPPPPAASTGATIRLRPADIARRAPDWRQMRVVWRRRRPE